MRRVPTNNNGLAAWAEMRTPVTLGNITDPLPRTFLHKITRIAIWKLTESAVDEASSEAIRRTLKDRFHRPVVILDRVHQSGVNCLDMCFNAGCESCDLLIMLRGWTLGASAGALVHRHCGSARPSPPQQVRFTLKSLPTRAKMRPLDHSRLSQPASTFSIVSGGDDNAVSFIELATAGPRHSVSVDTADEPSQSAVSSPHSLVVRIKASRADAHSSSVKGELLLYWLDLLVLYSGFKETEGHPNP